MRVLLIDDDETTRCILTEVLTDEGIEVDALAFAEDALVLLGAGQVPDVLVTDVNLGAGLSGPDLADIARAKYPSVEIVFISGNPVDSTGKTLGPHEHVLVKPFLPSELLQLIRDYGPQGRE